MNPTRPRTYALVTAGAHRIGSFFARKLHQLGFAIIIHYRNSADEAQQLQQEIVADQGIAEIVQADFRHQRESEKLIRFCLQFNWQLYVNNASLFRNDHPHSIKPELLRQHMEINVLTPQLISQALAQTEAKEKLIIHILDAQIHHTPVDFYSYHISRYALVDMLAIQALAFAPTTRVNGIAPGFVLRNSGQPEQKFASKFRDNPLEVGVTCDHLGHAIEYLCRNLAVTGEILTVAGGGHLQAQTP